MHLFRWSDYPRLLADDYYRSPAACGANHQPMTCSPSGVDCDDCLATVGLPPIDRRSPEQIERDLAGALWRGFTR